MGIPPVGDEGWGVDGGGGGNKHTQTQIHTNVRILVRTRSAKAMGEDEITSDIIFEENESSLTDCTPSLYFFKVLIQHNLSLSLFSSR